MTNPIPLLSLIAAGSMVLVGIGISFRQQLGVEKEMVIGAIRAFLQLMLIGYLLNLIFDLAHPAVTTLFLLIMISVATQNAANRGRGIPGVQLIVGLGIGLATVVTLSFLLGLRIISFRPWEVIPISGMIVGNAMVASGLVLNRLRSDIENHRMQILAALALGATSRQAVSTDLQGAIRAGMIPTIDGMKTLGIVQLPGMMTGLILAGADPIQAVRYQIVVAFMLTTTVAVTAMTVGLLTARQYFTPAHQLVEEFRAKGS